MIRALLMKDTGEISIEEFKSFKDIEKIIVTDKNNKIYKTKYKQWGNNYFILKPHYHRAGMNLNKAVLPLMERTYPPRGNAVLIKLYKDTDWYISMDKKEALDFYTKLENQRAISERIHWMKY